MGRNTIQRNILLGMMSVVLLLVLLFALDSWLAGGRVEDGVLRLRDAFLEAELRWVLEAAFREAGWPREAARLRDLAAWIRPLLARKRRRAHAWGGWRLEPEPLGWSLHPKDGSGRLEPTSLEAP